jgi:signal transduction histidine kinase
LLAITYGLFERATEFRKPELPAIPHTPSIQRLQLPLTQAVQQLAGTVHQLTQVPHRLAEEVAQVQNQLTQAQQQLAHAQHQLAEAARLLAQAGSLEAAQRAADSHQLLVNSGIALAIVALLALLAGWLVAGRILRPIRTITRTARRISSTSLHERLALDGPEDELKELGDTLDDLFGRLATAFDAQRHFVANASHELRTPLTYQRALIQVALSDPGASIETLRAGYERLLASGAHQERLIEALLALSRGQAGLDRRECLDLAAITDQVLLGRHHDAREGGIRIRTAVALAPITGDPRLVERLVANLLDNALHYNQPGGQVDVAVRPECGHAVLSIANSGPQIQPEAIDRLLQPFQRLGEDRTDHNDGLGLGLSIVQAIATAHNATLNIEARQAGGLSIDVTFPKAAVSEQRRQDRSGLAASR